MRLEHLAARLEVAGIATRGSNLFVNYMPPEAVNGLVLIPSLSGDAIDWDLGSRWRKNASFQLIVRTTASNFNGGYDLAKRAIDALTITSDTEFPADGSIPKMSILHIRPKHDVICYPRSPNNLIEFSVNFDVAYILG